MSTTTPAPRLARLALALCLVASFLLTPGIVTADGPDAERAARIEQWRSERLADPLTRARMSADRALPSFAAVEAADDAPGR